MKEIFCRDRTDGKTIVERISKIEDSLIEFDRNIKLVKDAKDLLFVHDLKKYIALSLQDLAPVKRRIYSSMDKVTILNRKLLQIPLILN